MKKTDKKDPVNTTPKNAWEAGKSTDTEHAEELSASTDAQGNGYPDKDKTEKDCGKNCK